MSIYNPFNRYFHDVFSERTKPVFIRGTETMNLALQLFDLVVISQESCAKFRLENVTAQLATELTFWQGGTALALKSARNGRLTTKPLNSCRVRQIRIANRPEQLLNSPILRQL